MPRQEPLLDGAWRLAHLEGDAPPPRARGLQRQRASVKPTALNKETSAITSFDDFLCEHIGARQRRQVRAAEHPSTAAGKPQLGMSACRVWYW